MRKPILMIAATLIVGMQIGGLQATEKPPAERNLSWRIPRYWHGELSTAREPGITGNISCLKSVPVKDKYLGQCYHLSRIGSLWGRKFCFTVRVRGQGEIRLGLLQHLSGMDGRIRVVSDWNDDTIRTLSPGWQDISYEFGFDEPGVSRFGVMVEVSGESAAVYLAEGAITAVRTPGITLSAVPSHPMVEVEKPLPKITFSLSRNGAPFTGQSLTLLEGAKTEEAVTDTQGKVVLQPPVGTQHVAASYPGSGIAVEAHVDALPTPLYQAFDETARKITLNKPLHLLFIGDSLSDFERGRNYVDKVNFWLNRYNPGNVSFRNAGVGGDYITRVLQRLTEASAFRKEMYDGIFDRRADYIFIFLGHNDTRSLSTNNYAEPLVSPQVQESSYRKVVDILHERSNAKIVLVSATSSNFEICRANAEKLKAAGRTHSLFGEPEKLEAFNAALQRLANELNLDYLDVYNPTRNAPDKMSLFSPTDGVHLTEAGNRLIAAIALEYLQKETAK